MRGVLRLWSQLENERELRGACGQAPSARGGHRDAWGPGGLLARSAEEAAQAAERLAPCVVKAQVATGKRGKAGGIRLAADPEAAQVAAEAILGMTIGEHRVEKVLIEEQVAFAREMYAAVLNDPASKGPLLLFSAEGGMDIEEIAARHPHALVRLEADIRTGLDAELLDR